MRLQVRLDDHVCCIIDVTEAQLLRAVEKSNADGMTKFTMRTIIKGPVGILAGAVGDYIRARLALL